MNVNIPDKIYTDKRYAVLCKSPCNSLPGCDGWSCHKDSSDFENYARNAAWLLTHDRQRWMGGKICDVMLVDTKERKVLVYHKAEKDWKCPHCGGRCRDGGGDNIVCGSCFREV